MIKGQRVCPVCTSCGSKKFKVIDKNESQVIVECLSCAKRIIV
ncbi:MAG TPA: hypothetical protein VE732_05615 [Nitrososphaera sp.]|nr:hypothetical protein [Nitrososphaera sp.]